MDIHCYPWISMDIHWYPLISEDIHGHPWISEDIQLSIDIQKRAVVSLVCSSTKPDKIHIAICETFLWPTTCWPTNFALIVTTLDKTTDIVDTKCLKPFLFTPVCLVYHAKSLTMFMCAEPRFAFSGNNSCFPVFSNGHHFTENHFRLDVDTFGHGGSF